MRDLEVAVERGGGTVGSRLPETLREQRTFVKEDWRSLLEDCSVRLMEGRWSHVDDESSGGRPVNEMPRAREFWLLER